MYDQKLSEEASTTDAALETAECTELEADASVFIPAWPFVTTYLVPLDKGFFGCEVYSEKI